MTIVVCNKHARIAGCVQSSVNKPRE